MRTIKVVITVFVIKLIIFIQHSFVHFESYNILTDEYTEQTDHTKMTNRDSLGKCY